MKSTFVFLALAGAAFASADLTTLNLSTGLDASGNVFTSGDQRDANWLVSNANSYLDPSTNGNGQHYAYTVASGDANFYPSWPAPDGLSLGICSNPDLVNGNGNMTFDRFFTLSQVELNSIITGVAGTGFSSFLVSCDDGGDVYLNGHHEASDFYNSTDGPAFNQMRSITLNAQDLQVGVNDLQIQISGSDSSYEEARLEGGLTYQMQAVPEPVSLALFGLGAIVLVARNRK